MLGAIIGDIVGSRWEFNPTNDYNFELFSDKNSYTDDTICTIAVADAILHGSNDFGQYIHSWCRRYPHPMGGYGGRFAQWVMSDNPRPYGSYGNGAAMRVSPVAWASNSQEEILHAAKLTASCTHNHPEGIKGAQAIASAIRNARILREQYGGNWGKEEIRDFVRETVWKFPEYNIDIQIEKVKNRFDETCGGTVPVALWVIQNSTGFEDAIRRAVSLGADADTLGAIVGSIAEALWGIPEWIKKESHNVSPRRHEKCS
jgi:ADP-ribosylglycohydrolase